MRQQLLRLSGKGGWGRPYGVVLEEVLHVLRRHGRVNVLEHERLTVHRNAHHLAAHAAKAIDAELDRGGASELVDIIMGVEYAAKPTAAVMSAMFLRSGGRAGWRIATVLAGKQFPQRLRASQVRQQLCGHSCQTAHIHHATMHAVYINHPVMRYLRSRLMHAQGDAEGGMASCLSETEI